MQPTLRYLMKVEGLPGRFNNIIYIAGQQLTKPEDNHHQDVKKWNSVCYFGGDLQNFHEQMIQNNEHQFLNYSLETVAKKLSNRFPQENILVVQPSNVFKSFSRFENFVQSIDVLGTPKFDQNDRSCYDHFLKLLINVYKIVHQDQDHDDDDCDGSTNLNFEVTMISFSKGQVVFNQLARSLRLIDSSENSAAKPSRIKFKEFYLLDGGHNNPSDLWITDPKLIEALLINGGCQCIRICVTDFQLNKPNRARQEVSEFHKILISRSEQLLVSMVHLRQQDYKHLSLIQLHFKCIDLLFEGRLFNMQPVKKRFND